MPRVDHAARFARGRGSSTRQENPDEHADRDTEQQADKQGEDRIHAPMVAPGADTRRRRPATAASSDETWEINVREMFRA